MTEITKENFTAAMIAAVEERGEDFTYPPRPTGGEVSEWYAGPMCVYSKADGTPACLIGLALHKINPGLVPPYEESFEVFVDMSAGNVLAEAGCTDSLVRMAADAAQLLQDEGHNWGDALEAYLREVNQPRR